MSEPSRLVDDAVPPEIANLLRSAEGDVPPDEQAQTRRIITSAGSTGALGAAPAPRAQSSRLVRNVAWIGLAAAMFTISAAGLHAMLAGDAPPRRADLPRRTAAVVVNAPATPSTPIDERAKGTGSEIDEGAKRTRSEIAKAPAALPSLRVEELPSAIAPRESAAPSTSARREQPPSVEDELKVIDAARAALAANQPAAAHAHLQRYRATFRPPHFVDEADALEVQTLAALGQHEEARAKAERFVEAHPGSPYTQRVRSAAGLRSGAVVPRQ